MLVTLLANLRNKDYKITELGFLLEALPVRILAFEETLGATLNLHLFVALVFSSQK